MLPGSILDSVKLQYSARRLILTRCAAGSQQAGYFKDFKAASHQNMPLEQGNSQAGSAAQRSNGSAHAASSNAHEPLLPQSHQRVGSM